MIVRVVNKIYCRKGDEYEDFDLLNECFKVFADDDV